MKSQLKINANVKFELKQDQAFKECYYRLNFKKIKF